MTDPGSWHYFVQRADMKNKTLNEQKSQFLKEQINHQNTLAIIANTSANIAISGAPASAGVYKRVSGQVRRGGAPSTKEAYPSSVQIADISNDGDLGYIFSDNTILTRSSTLINDKPIYTSFQGDSDGDHIILALFYWDEQTDANGDTVAAGWDMYVDEEGDPNVVESDTDIATKMQEDINSIATGGGAFEDLSYSLLRQSNSDGPITFPTSLSPVGAYQTGYTSQSYPDGDYYEVTIA